MVALQVNNCYISAMETITPVDALKKAVEQSKGRRLFAEKLSASRDGLKVSIAMVWNWINRDNGAPADYCPDIEALTGVRCEDLRPEVNWAALRKTPRKVKEVA